MCVWVPLILLKTENLLLKIIKKIIYELLFTAKNIVQHCSFALMHCSCSMNSARGISPKKEKKTKKKKRQNEEMRTPNRDPNLFPMLRLLGYY